MLGHLAGLHEGRTMRRQTPRPVRHPHARHIQGLHNVGTLRVGWSGTSHVHKVDIPGSIGDVIT